ncbi:uncharacterized protein PV09_07100 [Verruconis gallopava]|uniref:RING-type domain-containing protein n=1 Tax=Verruconis gallopava TaxID=253628 RepID=A0A0D2A4D3_9PEZI|nr:uncharacterized protein PV09_07100 [Verruconis gallopava]KIW01325.1 hypothetical protein PV09_07100 [Verruconis gallopava]
MDDPWHVYTAVVSGIVTSYTQLFDYLQWPHACDEVGSAAAEPPSKRRKIERTSDLKEDTVDSSSAILLAEQDIYLHFDSNSSAVIDEDPREINITSLTLDSNDTAVITVLPAHPRREKKNEELQLLLYNPSDDLVARLRDICPLPPSLLSNVTPAWSLCRLQPHTESGVLVLRTQIFVAAERSWIDSRQSRGIDALVQKYLPFVGDIVGSRWSPQDFYENVHVPPPHLKTPQYLEKTELTCSLYPFQKRAVQWMLEREGVTPNGCGLVAQPDVQSPDHVLPPSFRAIRDARGDQCYFSNVHRVFIKNKWSLLDYLPELKGGILAEEMGLGKTVELIALTTLHKLPAYLCGKRTGEVTQSPSTLIITPAHILRQWMNEIATHAPHLKVLHYHGLSGQHADNGSASSSHARQTRDITVSQLMEYDVVLTTYNVLAREIHFADKPPDRSMRHAPKYKRRRSPLVLTKWWRVCLDEAQLIESGVSQAATVARLIPRTNAWAVSGTPLKKNVEDLHGLLIFLGYEPFATSKKSWQRIDKATLKQIFSTIALRHNKHKVAHELRLPPQRRVVITMPFTAIEEQNYNQLYGMMCSSLGLNTDGSPAVDDWQPEQYVESMRSWLKRLRETCLHPQVGTQNRRALGRGTGPLRTVNEVLETMIEQNQSELRAQERSLILAQVVRGQIVNNDKSNESRSEAALRLYQEALGKAEVLVEECRKEYATELAKLKELKCAEKRIEYSSSVDSGSDSEDNPEARGRRRRLAALKKQLRSALEALHVCVFFVATSYYQMKEVEKATKETEDTDEFRRLEELEVQHYERAKGIRRELLQPAHKEATVAMFKIKTMQRTKDGIITVTKIPSLSGQGGIENRKILEKFDVLAKILDLQADLINKWREKIIQTLTGPLVDAEEDQEITGEEYEESTKLQDELYVYVMGLRAIISDRQQCISGEANLLMDIELKQAVAHSRSDRENANKGHAVELLYQIVDERKKIRIKPSDGSLQALVSEARSMASALSATTPSGRAAVEASLIEKVLDDVRKVTSTQRETIKALEKELSLFHTCMNSRVEYYRQLQELSDMVAPWKEQLDDELDRSAYEEQASTEDLYLTRLATLKTKQRFLLHLRAESSKENEARICVICTDSFENGVLTVCGHQYCKDCITAWWRNHRTCPECRRVLTRNDVHDITYRPQQLKAKEEQNEASGSTSPSPSRERNTVVERSTTSSIYSNISEETMRQIKSVDLDGSFGTKVDTICRHLLWLRENDPGAKSIIFSQYSDFLEVLATALKYFKISAVSIREHKGIDKFRADPSKECFLLDAKSDSSGLNLVNATHVFLCEPLVNAAIELQAIARVHRIGQMRETTVYMYLISDTVEEAIYDISVSRRLSHLGRASNPSSASQSNSGVQTPVPMQEISLDVVNNFEMQQAPISTLLAKGKGEGELVDVADLWNCLFGKPRQSLGGISGALQTEVNRHLATDAAESRRADSHVAGHQ